MMAPRYVFRPMTAADMPLLKRWLAVIDGGLRLSPHDLSGSAAGPAMARAAPCRAMVGRSGRAICARQRRSR